MRDNNLNVGDVCKFVLIDANRLSFEVVIEAGNSTLSLGQLFIIFGIVIRWKCQID